MLIKYYNNKELAYTNRKRYGKFSFSPFATEEQKSVLLGDGATTLIKTKKSNICNYVTIDDTRWYVTSYVYLNGGQVQLNLQRDVVGEFGIGECFGKIERGYTENFLRNRKELNLNQILKDRKYLIPETNSYGSYSVDNHNGEKWGILYLIKPTEINPDTGKRNTVPINVNIEALTPEFITGEILADGAELVSNIKGEECYFEVKLGFTNYYPVYLLKIYYIYNDSKNIFEKRKSIELYSYNNTSADIIINITNEVVLSEGDLKRFAEVLLGFLFQSEHLNEALILPEVPEVVDIPRYNNVIVKDTTTNEFYSYTVTTLTDSKAGRKDYNGMLRWIADIATASDISVPRTIDFVGVNEIITVSYNVSTLKPAYIIANAKSKCIVEYKKYSRRNVPPNEVGSFDISVRHQFVDEPFAIIVCPLFNTKITGNGEIFDIEQKTAFSIFNSVIQYLSGENPYIVDAQIYPYCPVLTSTNVVIGGIPFFNIASTSYEHNCRVNLLPNIDIKKEYIQRVYSIISPDQTGKFNFNFYDYVNKIETRETENSLENYRQLSILVKTALKPFSIVSSACIIPEYNSLMGITYDSDLRGSQPSSNGFECSISSNAFESYKRQNSNYQQIFSLQREELQKQHEVERVNEKTAKVVNTITATAMGAIGGANVGGIFGSIGKGIGAIGGGVSAGAVVGNRMDKQYETNEELREYEVTLQKQMFDLEIGTIKNLPNTVSRISSFNEIIMRDFWYIVEIYECSEEEKEIVDDFIKNYGYGIGVFDYLIKYQKNGWFLRSTLVSSNYPVNLHLIAEKEFMGGIYYYEQV